MSDDTRTLKDLAKEALSVQDASNLSGVVHSWSRAITRLRALLEQNNKGGTHAVNTHPINQLWADKVASLTDTQSIGLTDLSKAYEAVTRVAQSED
jgi:hypothetical protein